MPVTDLVTWCLQFLQAIAAEIVAALIVACLRRMLRKYLSRH